MTSPCSKPAGSSHLSYSDADWQRIGDVGQVVDRRLQVAGVRLTMGGEPTFISKRDFESPQWRTEALGADKRHIAEQLLKHLQQHFAIGGSLLHYGLGKLYPGENQPRWALGCYWREDGAPLWNHPEYLAAADRNYGHTPTIAKQFARRLTTLLGISTVGLHEARDSLTDEWAGFVVPLLPVQHNSQLRWSTCRWVLSNSSDSLHLLKGDSQIGLRLPMHAIAWSDALAVEANASLDAPEIDTEGAPVESPPNSICVALGIEIRYGTIRIFIPPLGSARSFVDAIGAIERVAVETSTPILIEGYPPPANSGITGFQITPDPGVLEVNIHPVGTWPELVEQTEIVYEAADACGLTARKVTENGHLTSTGGGAHITIGGATPTDSPLLRRPDVLRSLIGYWQNHPSLSYLFAGLFVGPTSQAPRLDESRLETPYELEIAFQYLQPGQTISPDMLDSLLSRLLVDASGNAHRTALCIDKLYPSNNPRLQLGLLEFRGFAMPPNARMRLLQLLLVRSLIALVWEQPYTEPLIRWGTQLHDRFLLPHYLQNDLQVVLSDLANAGMQFPIEWFEPFFSVRFPRYGVARLEESDGEPMTLELRQAIEPWNVIDAGNNVGTSRAVDASLERIQVKLQLSDKLVDKYDVTCNGYRVPLAKISEHAWVGGVRFRTRQMTIASHPATTPHRELVFEVVDRQLGRSRGGCTYYPASANHQSDRDPPKSIRDAASRVAESFKVHNAHVNPCQNQAIATGTEYPSLLDLRRVASSAD